MLKKIMLSISLILMITAVYAENETNPFHFVCNEKMKLNAADLSGVRFIATDSSDCRAMQFKKATLINVFFSQENNYSGSDFTGAKLSSAILDGANFSKSNLSQALMNLVSISNANLYQANLKKVTIKYSRLSGTNFSGANLSEAMILGSDMSSADFTKARLYKANITASRFIGSNFSKANFSSANLRQSVMVGTNVKGANFKNAILDYSHFEHSNITQKQVKSAKSTCYATLPKGIKSNCKRETLKQVDGKSNAKHKKKLKSKTSS